MPIYEYQATSEQSCSYCAQRFEYFQSFSEAALERCPECGAPIARLLSTPTIHGAGRSADVLSNKSLAEKGFTKYVKSGDGYYEKAAGKGPDVIKR
jgi:putative FmdB family regulatory protein